MDIRLVQGKTVYGFTRGDNGVGYWHCISGHIPGMMGRPIHGLIVPRNLSQKLSVIAMKQGLGSRKDFAKVVKIEKPVRVVRAASGKSKKSSMFGSFNPFEKLIKEKAAAVGIADEEREEANSETDEELIDNAGEDFLSSFFDNGSSKTAASSEAEYEVINPQIISKK